MPCFLFLSKKKIRNCNFCKRIKMESDSEEIDEVEEAAEKAINEIIPEKSKAVYEKRYKDFCNWMALKNKREVNETLLLAYFNSELRSAAPSTKWCIFSMLKAMLKTKKNIDIGSYTTLVLFLKRKSKGFKPAKSKTFEKSDVFKFLQEANDTDYLAAKVVLIMGVSGACRRQELAQLEKEDVKDLGSCLSVDIRYTKTGNSRQLFISSGEDGLDFVKIVKKYMELRPRDIDHNRFFVQFIKGRCTRQPMGVNKLALFPKIIAAYLGLPNAEKYTGHCFRRTSATMLPDAGGDVNPLKRHGDWRSSNVAEGYVNDSMSNRKDVANKILGRSSSEPVASTSRQASNGFELMPYSIPTCVAPALDVSTETSPKKTQPACTAVSSNAENIKVPTDAENGNSIKQELNNTQDPIESIEDGEEITEFAMEAIDPSLEAVSPCFESTHLVNQLGKLVQAQMEFMREFKKSSADNFNFKTQLIAVDALLQQLPKKTAEKTLVEMKNYVLKKVNEYQRNMSDEDF